MERHLGPQRLTGLRRILEDLRDLTDP